MSSALSRLQPISALAPWTIPFAAWAAIHSLVIVDSDPTAQQETRFLALWVMALLLAMVASQRGSRSQGTAQTSAALASVPLATAVLVAAATWAAPPAPLRGALVGLLLCLGALISATWVWWRPDEGSSRPLEPSTTVPLALAFQWLARPDLFLAPLLEPLDLVHLLVLPVVCALALGLLSQQEETQLVLVVGATAFVLAPGWTVGNTLALVALAVGGWMRSSQTILGDRTRPFGLVVLLTIALWQFPLGALSSLAGLARFGGRRASLPVLLLAGSIAFFSSAGVDRLSALTLWIGGVCLIPAVFLSARKEHGWMRTGLVLALAGALLGKGPEPLVSGLCLAALALPSHGAGARLQRLWSALLFGGTLLLAAYPWVRTAPRLEFLGLLGLQTKETLLLPLVLVVGLGSMLELWNRTFPRLRVQPVFLVLLLLLGVAGRYSGPSLELLDNYRSVALDTEEQPRLNRAFDEQRVATVILDTNLVQGLSLPEGTPVAMVHLRDREGQRIRSWPLRAGIHTGEWAAARPDVAQHPNFSAPRPWLSQLAPDGTFFARRYRARFHVPEPAMASQLSVAIRSDLPAGTQVVVYRLEVRP